MPAEDKAAMPSVVPQAAAASRKLAARTRLHVVVSTAWYRMAGSAPVTRKPWRACDGFGDRDLADERAATAN